MDEQWKPVPGFNGYEASSLGHIRSYHRFGPSEQANCPQRRLRQQATHNGYLAVILYREGARYFRQVHRLVLSAFEKRPSNLHQVNHRNGDKHDNRLENLEWVSPSENMSHAFSVLNHDPHNYGELHHYAKLTNADVFAIRRQWATGLYTQRELSEKYGVGPDQISRIVNRKAWKQAE